MHHFDAVLELHFSKWQTQCELRTQSLRPNPGHCHSRKGGWVALGIHRQPSFSLTLCIARDLYYLTWDGTHIEYIFHQLPLEADFN